MKYGFHVQLEMVIDSFEHALDCRILAAPPVTPDFERVHHTALEYRRRGIEWRCDSDEDENHSGTNKLDIFYDIRASLSK